MNPVDYNARRRTRAAACIAAADDPAAIERLLAGWGARVGLAERIAALEPPDDAGFEQLVTWALDGPPGGAAGPEAHTAGPGELSEAELDRQGLARVAAVRGTAPVARRRAAALYLLVRLREEMDRRERDAWIDARYPASPQDAEASRVWAEMLEGRVGLDTGRRVRKLFGGAVRRAFAAVGGALGLPAGVIREHTEGAIDALEYLPYGAHLDVAARVLEARGEPVASCASLLGPATTQVVGGCVDGREAWRPLRDWGALDHPEALAPALPFAVDALVGLRLVEHLRSGVPPAPGLGLPGWLVVSQNRGKVRGRLRAVVVRDTPTIRLALLKLDALHARSDAAMARHAWDWAWREARAGFSFDIDRMRAPGCTLPAPGEPILAPIPATAEPSVRTALLVLIARGCWVDLNRWLDRAPSRELGDSFYRYLREVPDDLGDPQPEGRRSRTYHRLREHLDGVLDGYLPVLEAVAARVGQLREGRELKATLHRALTPDWDAVAVPLPRHHLGAIVRNFQEFLSSAAVSGGDDEPGH